MNRMDSLFWPWAKSEAETTPATPIEKVAKSETTAVSAVSLEESFCHLGVEEDAHAPRMVAIIYNDRKILVPSRSFCEVASLARER